MSKIFTPVVGIILLSKFLTAEKIPSFDYDRFQYMGSYKEKSASALSKLGGSTSHYFLSSNSADWFEAQADCRAFLGNDATLVNLETNEEYETLDRIIDRMDITISSFWTGGLYNVETGMFEWTNGIQFDGCSHWEIGYPNTYDKLTKVAAVNSNRLRLRTQFQTITARYCCEVHMREVNNTDIVKCEKPNDLILLIDASWSISAEQFKLALQFSKKLTCTWLRSDDSRVSVIVFASTVTTLFTLEDSTTLDEREVAEMIDAAPYSRGKTFTHLALDEALLQFSGGDRSNGDDAVIRNTIVLTDGISDYPTQTIDTATKLLSSGIQIFSVGNGETLKESELLAMTGNVSERVFLTDYHNSSSWQSLPRPVSVALCDNNVV